MRPPFHVLMIPDMAAAIDETSMLFLGTVFEYANGYTADGIQVGDIVLADTDTYGDVLKLRITEVSVTDGYVQFTAKYLEEPALPYFNFIQSALISRDVGGGSSVTFDPYMNSGYTLTLLSSISNKNTPSLAEASISDEDLTYQIDGVRSVFRVKSGFYVADSLAVQIGGIGQVQDKTFFETNADVGEFSFDGPLSPEDGDLIVSYKVR